ncbi:MAG: hypothetical protein VB093_02295, partial [Propionicimonas sp.]|nr:hypothetical protein [Propionicimonas sp.]
VVSWDSPTVTSWADAIPTKAEFTVEWASTNVTTLPNPGGGEDQLNVRPPSQPPGSTSTEVYTLSGKWAYDSRSGETQFSLGIASSGDPKGLAAIDSTFLAVALALAPTLLAGIGAAGVDGAAVRMAALAIATGVVATVAKEGEVVINSAEIEHRQRSLTDQTGSRTRVLLDYTAAVGFDIDASGIGSIATDAGYPLKVRYHKVGLEFDDSKDRWDEKFGLVYDDVSFEVADSGRWKLDGPLGQLLQVVGSRAGVGSTWFECDLAFALDLGVVSITGATVRATWGDAGFSAELRGLGLSVEIPGVLKGAGRVVLGDGGAFKAALELEIVAAGAKASGSLSFDPATDFLSIALGLVLPVGIPLASTGLGIFGFLGNFVSNGQRALPSGHDNDPVGREIAWYRAPAVDKYQPQRGQWAVGLGMIVGTMPDQAFTFNATGMFVVAFPDPAVVFGIDAKLVKKPAAEPSSQGNQPTAGLQILGLIAVDDQAVMIGVRGEYTIPKVLKLKLPIDGYFPYPTTNGDAYVRIGSDGVVAENRPGDPVTITLLPDTLNVTAWAYLMIEAKKLHNLGGDSRFSFDGFSIGFGAGFEIRWSAGPIKLVASAKLLVGFGVNPFLLKGGIFVAGELDLVILSVSASGELICTIWDDHGTLKTNLSGKFCGKVSLFFFSISGCVGVEIGDSLSPEAPEPAAPVGKVSLTDRRGFTTAVATTGTPGSEQTVWPDTVPVIEFTHHVDLALAAGCAFDPGPAPAGPVWSGSSELKYAYQLTDIQLIPDGGTPLPGPLDSGWWLPTHRPGVLDAGAVAVSEAEGAFLGLMAWDPAPWTYWLTDGGAGTDADPAGTVGRLCDPPRPARPNCALGKLGVRTGVDSVRIPTADAGSPPFPSRFDLLGAERAFGRPLEAIAPILAASGATLVPGQVTAGGFGDDVWWLARTTRYGFTERTTEFRGTLAPDLTRPELVLVVCQDHRRRPGGIRAGLTCAHPDYPDGGIVLGGSATLGPVTVESMDGDLVTIGVGNDQSIGFTQGVIAALPTTTGLVEITLHLPGTEAKAIGYDNTGTPVADAATSVGQGLVTLTLAGDGIVKVEVYGGGRRIGLVSICWGAATSQAVVADLPEVRGRLADGSEQAWSPKVLAQTRTDSSLCRLVSYTPSTSDRVWAGMRIREWAGTGKQDAGGVGIVRLCGVTGPAAGQAQANQDFAHHLAEVINLHGLDGSAAHKDLLQPATGYTLLVNYRWQGWLKSDGQPTPPTVPDPTKWKDASAPVSLRFRTADHATVTGVPPTELTDEQAFDPRSLLRYLIAFQPDTGAAPHLLDDTLLVHLAVDHADQLAGLYGRDLMLRLRRTDPPPGSLATAAHAPDEQLTVTWGPLFDVYRPLGQRRFLGAVREAPCLSEPSLGGTTGEVTADLVPGAWYDLILVAPRTGHPEDEDAVVARTHFQASRYHGVADLLGSLGFTSSGDEWPILAGDALVTAGLPGGGLVVGDAALDAALQGCGLDPWPLPEQARSSVLWLNDGGSWKLAGLLLEAAEPIVRTGRTALDVVAADYGGVALTQRVRNLAGTRVLLAPAGPVAVPAATQLQVTLTKTVTDAAGATTATATLGRRAAIGVPRAVYAEAGA